jgi:hypothetical protein
MAGKPIRYYLNYSDQARTFSYPHESGTDILTQSQSRSQLNLSPWGLVIVERNEMQRILLALFRPRFYISILPVVWGQLPEFIRRSTVFSGRKRPGPGDCGLESTGI